MNSSSNSSVNDFKKIPSDLHSDEDNTKILNSSQSDRENIDNNDSGVGSSKILTAKTATSTMFSAVVFPMSEESLLCKLSSNNPFYRFHKQSHSFKMIHCNREPKIDFPIKIVRKAMSDSNIPKDVVDEDFSLEINDQQEVRNNNLENDSMVITNPFSSGLLDNRKTKHPPQTQTILVKPIKSHRSERSFRRFFDTATLRAKSQRSSTNDNGNDLFICKSPLRLPDFPESSYKEESKSRSVFKNIVLRKAHKQNDCLHPNPPQLRKLKISFPDRTQSIQSIRAEIKPSSSSYFGKLHLKTRLGIRRIKEKCRTFKHSSADDSNRRTFKHSSADDSNPDTKDDSFKFISDRTKITHYETKCTRQPVYKSYKSELDLTKNLHYLDAYLQQNYDKNLSGYKKTSHSVGKFRGSTMLRHKHQVKDKIHKRSLSCGKVVTIPRVCNFETIGALPFATKSAEEHSDSVSSSDYASVFSEPADSNMSEHIEPSVRYEHPSISEFFYDKLLPYTSDKNQLFLESERFHLPNEKKVEENERTLQIMLDTLEFPYDLIVDTTSLYQHQNDDRNVLICDNSYQDSKRGFYNSDLRSGRHENYLEHYNRNKKKTIQTAPEDNRSARTRRNLGGIEYSMSKLKTSDVINIPDHNRQSDLLTSSDDYGDSIQLLSKSHPAMPYSPTSSDSMSTLTLSTSLQSQKQMHSHHRNFRQKKIRMQPHFLTTAAGENASTITQHSTVTASRNTNTVPIRYSSQNPINDMKPNLSNDEDDNASPIQIASGFGPTVALTPQGMPSKSFSSTSASSSTISSSVGGCGGSNAVAATFKYPASLASISRENICKFYQQQQKPPTSSLNSSSSTNSSSVPQQHQQNILALKYHHQEFYQSKNQLAPTGVDKFRHQQSGQPQATVTNRFRRSSTISNTSSDNFDSFITQRYGGASAGISNNDGGSNDKSMKRSSHRISSIHRNGYDGGSNSNKANTVVKGNYFVGIDLINNIDNVHRGKHITSIQRAYNCKTSENYILEYEC
ncbi:uncharacterized protein LOC129913584 [Episyrphus balteatus]|uniref:uncharacterized protein LOC129913584 n=1 Tax=Episyrphus balteatus TaxID=286459 RepID=UPI002485F698|nr:uncharacterized protein LOC129913584 [Episyrphus balteatus]